MCQFTSLLTEHFDLTANIICICYYSRWLSWPFHVHVRVSSYTALFRVSLGGVGLRCVGLAQKISARCNTGFYVFSFFFICIFILFLASSHSCFFIPSARSPKFGSRLWKVNIDQNYYYYLFQRTPAIYNLISQENVFLFAIYFHKNMKLGPAKFFCFVFATTSIEKSKAITPEKFACSVLPVEGKSMLWNVMRPL